jgi:Mannosyltransferase putative
MQELRAAIAERLGKPVAYPQNRFADRGIVTCAGGRRYFTCVWVLIWTLRHVHQSTLPIQVWHLGRAEMSDGMRLLLQEEDVEVVDAEAVIDNYPARVSGGWPLKPYAIAHSRFREVLFLDADTVPLVDPAIVFECDLYRKSGLLFWPNILDLREDNPIWTTLGLQPRRCAGIDSGVIAVDKQRAWQVLDLAISLNEHWEDLYNFVNGDKDTLLLAALLAGGHQEMVPHRPFSFDSDVILRDFDGQPIIHHRTCSKWNLFGSNRPMVAEALTSHCEEALAELRRRWTGAIFHPPDRSRKARAQEAALIAIRYFRYETTADHRRLELLSAGNVGEGRADLEQHWAVVDRDSTLVLQFFSETRLSVELLPQADGSWRGQSTGKPAVEAKLIPESGWQTWPYADNQQIPRSAEDQIAVLLDPVLFAGGFDPEVQHELQAALLLLNRLFDDVPELLVSRFASMDLSESWRTSFRGFSQRLAAMRDARLSRTLQGVADPPAFNSDSYAPGF